MIIQINAASVVDLSFSFFRNAIIISARVLEKQLLIHSPFRKARRVTLVRKARAPKITSWWG
jgi:hypothetical protein